MKRKSTIIWLEEYRGSLDNRQLSAPLCDIIKLYAVASRALHSSDVRIRTHQRTSCRVSFIHLSFLRIIVCYVMFNESVENRIPFLDAVRIH